MGTGFSLARGRCSGGWLHNGVETFITELKRTVKMANFMFYVLKHDFKNRLKKAERTKRYEGNNLIMVWL